MCGNTEIEREINLTFNISLSLLLLNSRLCTSLNLLSQGAETLFETPLRPGRNKRGQKFYTPINYGETVVVTQGCQLRFLFRIKSKYNESRLFRPQRSVLFGTVTSLRIETYYIKLTRPFEGRT